MQLPPGFVVENTPQQQTQALGLPPGFQVETTPGPALAKGDRLDRGVSETPPSAPASAPALSDGPATTAPQFDTPTPPPTEETIAPGFKVEYAPDRPQPKATALDSPFDDTHPPGADPSRPWSFMNGLVTDLVQQNPKTVADGMEMYSLLAGDPNVSPVASLAKSLSNDIRGWVTDPGQYKKSGIQAFGPNGVKSFGDALTLIGETAGEFVASMLPNVAAGMAGAAAGGRIAGRYGAMGGAAMGVGASNLPMAHGELFSNLVEAGVDKQRAAVVAWAPGLAIAALDTAFPAAIVSKLGGMQTVRREISRHVARRIAESLAKGGAVEATTEVAQTAIEEATKAIETGKPFFTEETGLALANSGVKGLIGGGLVGGGTGLQRDKVTTQAAPEDVASAGESMGVTSPPTSSSPALSATVTDNTTPPASPPTSPQPEQEVMGAPVFSGTPDPKPIWFSTLRKQVEEKGPNAATAEQWMATLANAPGVKQEEMQDLKLPAFFAGHDGKVTKDELIRHIEENSITIEERELTDGAQYGAYTMPGESEKYTELLMKLPIRPDNPNGRDQNYYAPHFRRAPRDPANVFSLPESNLLAHARMTERMDRDGNPTVVIEEIQSDWHQEGRKEGYRDESYTQQRKEAGLRLDALEKELFKAAETDATFQSALFSSPDTVFVLDHAVQKGYMTQEQAAAYVRDLDFLHKKSVPDAPFKSSWDELALKRVIRWAVDKGYRRIALAPASEHVRRYPGLNASQARGMQEFYDKKMPSLMKKWAKRMGGTVGVHQSGRLEGPRYELTTRGGVDGIMDRQMGSFRSLAALNLRPAQAMRVVQEENARHMRNEVGEDSVSSMYYIDLPEPAAIRVQQGLPLYNRMPPTSGNKGGVTIAPGSPDMMAIGEGLRPALEWLVNKFKLNGKLKLQFHPGREIRANGKVDTGVYGYLQPFLDMNGKYKRYEIHIATGTHDSAAHMWATVVHELGHAIFFEHFANAPTEIKTALREAHKAFLARAPKTGTNRNLIRQRDNAVAAIMREQHAPQWMAEQASSLGGRYDSYWTHFEEWMAEQVARWATTDAVAVSVTEKFFKGIGQQILRMYEAAMRYFKLPYSPDKAVADWLNSFHTEMPPFAAEVYNAADYLSTIENQRFMGPEETAVEQQVESGAVRERMEALFNGAPPREVRRAAAYVDKFNKIYKWMLGLHQVAQRNPHIAPLQQYTEMISVATLTKNQIATRAYEVVKEWNRLGAKRSQNLAHFIDDINNMVYRTAQEVQQKIARLPSPQEFAALVRQHGMDAEMLSTFRAIAKSFDDYLTRFQAVLMKEASKITDPAARQAREQQIILQIAGLRTRPYFPAMRFGNYTVTVRNAANQVIHFETFESKRSRKAIGNAIKAQLQPGQTIQFGYMDESVRTLLGVPTQLLDMMSEKLTLSTAQRDALEQLKFELSPAQSFKHRFQHKRRIAGYSMDFRRAYANYFFHGANHMMKVMYADDLRKLKDDIRTSSAKEDVTKRHQIANFVADHLSNWLDPKSDWMWLRSLAFTWSLAFSVAAATQNLTQTMLTTYPLLAAKFGDHKAIPTMVRVMREMETFTKQGKLPPVPQNVNNRPINEMEAISQGMADGVITEAMAPELAAVAEGNNLRGIGGNQLEQMHMWIMEKGSWMFQMAEQFNRRVMFRSAWRLAKQNPGADYVAESVSRHQLKYMELRGKGWMEEDAAAYVTAVDATHETQFRYGREFAPKFMQGKARAVFVFKTFITSYMAFLQAHPAAAVRSVLILGFLGGLTALPGVEDLDEILKAIGWKFFGKDWDLEKEARKYVLYLAGNDERGRQVADLVLHGVARQGFGLPAAMDALGGTVGVDSPVPTFDRSRAISAGTLLPVEFGKLYGPPTTDASQRLLDSTQKASGAVFGAMFNVQKAIMAERIDGSKRWEKAVPRALGSVMRASRYARDGMEKTTTGQPLVRYDVRDPQELAEVIGVALGYQPYRQSLKWDTVIAQREAAKMFDIRREMIMRQYWNALRGGDQLELEQMAGALRNFNEQLPDYAKGKALTFDSIRKSMQARARNEAAAENESAVRRSDVPIYRHVQGLYPESKANLRKVQ